MKKLNELIYGNELRKSTNEDLTVEFMPVEILLCLGSLRLLFNYIRKLLLFFYLNEFSES